MSKSDIKELTKSPFKGGNTDNYDKYFNDLKKIFDKNKDVSELDKAEVLFRDIEKLKIKTKDPVKLKIYGRILEENDLLHYANIFYEKIELLENMNENMNESMNKNVGDQVTIYWKGFPVSEGLIGSFIISRETHDRIEEEFGDSISIDFYDENVEVDKIDTYEDVINAMKNTEYGRIVTERVGTTDLPKDIALDLLPQVQKKKEELGKFTVKDLEDMMLANGASLKLLDDTVSELVNLDFDFDTEDEDANDYTNESLREATDLEIEVFNYLNDLRSSGVTNMYGAAPYITNEFPEIDKKEAIRLLTLWMKNFNEEGDYSMINEALTLTKEIIKDMRTTIRRKYPEFKFSITGDYNSITVAIMSGPIDFMKYTNKIYDGYAQLNPHLIEDTFKGNQEAIDMLTDIKDIISEGVYTVVDDGDYGKVPSHYYNIHIGKWDRPYVYTGENTNESNEEKVSEFTSEDSVNRADAADFGPVLINKLKDYLIINYIDNADKQFDISHILYLLGDLSFDLNTYEVETDSDSIIQLSKIFKKDINELANELSIVISDNLNKLGSENTNESLSTKEDKIDYIVFYTDKDKSTLEQMSDAVINKIYAETVKNATGEIVDEETDCDFGIDTDDLSVSNLKGSGINRALIGKEDEYGNIITEEELRNRAKNESKSKILTKSEFAQIAKEYKESNFGEIVEHGFKVKNIHPDISEKKFITDDINEAYKQYKSFMNLYSFNEDSINKEVLSKDEFIEGLREYEIEGGFGSIIETGFELYYVPENTLGYKKKFKTNSKEEAYKEYLDYMKTNEDDNAQPMTDQIDPEKRTKLRSVTVKYADGTVINTSMAAHLTDEDIRNYFKIGSLFNVGSYPNDNLQPVEEVIINESNTINEAVNENHKQVMPYQDESMKPWIIYPDSVEAPEKEAFDYVAVKNMIASDTFLKFAYENLMTGNFYEDMTTIYDTYIKNDEVNLEKLKTFENYTNHIIDEQLNKSELASLIIENMSSEITNDIKRQIYTNLNDLLAIKEDVTKNIIISTPEFKHDIKNAFKSNINEKLKAFRDNKIVLESFNDGNVLDYNNNAVSLLKTTLTQVSELFTTESLELNSELSVVATLAILKQ